MSRNDIICRSTLILLIFFSGKTSSTCGFEDKDLCGFKQADNKTDYHDWTWHKGATPSGWTGPTVDHTCRNDHGKM